MGKWAQRVWDESFSEIMVWERLRFQYLYKSRAMAAMATAAMKYEGTS